MDSIKKIEAQYRPIVNSLSANVDNSRSAYGVYDAFMVDVVERMDEINTSMQFLYAVNSANDIKMIFETVHNVKLIGGNINTIVSKFIKGASIHSDMSDTYVLDLSKSYNIINMKYAFVEAKVDKYLERYYESIAKILYAQNVNAVYNLFTAYPMTVSLFVQYAQNSPTTEVFKKVDEAKAFILGGGVKAEGTPMQRRGLIAVASNMTVDAVIKRVLNIMSAVHVRDPNRMYGGSEDLKKLDDFFREKKVGLVVMQYMADTEIRYEFNNIISMPVPAEFSSPDLSGLTARAVNWSHLIHASDNRRITTEISKLGKVESDRWVILRTVNRETFDIMGFAINDIYVNRAFVDLLDAPSTTVSSYQQICNNEFIKHVKPPKLIPENSEHKSTHLLRERLVQQMQVFIDDHLKSSKITRAGLFSMVSGRVVTSLTASILTETYKSENKKLPKELLSTYLRSTDNASRIFVKAIKERLAKSDITDMTFRERSGIDLTNYLRPKLYAIIKSAADKAFTAKSDMYQQLINKKYLLNVEL